MKQPEPMKNLWAVSTLGRTAEVIHKLKLQTAHAVPIFNAVNVLIAHGIQELSRSGRPPISCYLSFSLINHVEN
jgi:hypothetical protein